MEVPDRYDVRVTSEEIQDVTEEQIEDYIHFRYVEPTRVYRPTEDADESDYVGGIEVTLPVEAYLSYDDLRLLQKDLGIKPEIIRFDKDRITFY